MKNLNEEYNQNIENNVPDLWSRIDTKLDEIEKEKATPVAKPCRVPFYSTKWFKKVISCSGLAAAVLLIAILIYKLPGMHPQLSPTPPPAATQPPHTEASPTAPLQKDIISYHSPKQSENGMYSFNDIEYKYMLYLEGEVYINNESYIGQCQVLSNIEELTFEQAVEASPLGKDPDIVFDPKDAVIIYFTVIYRPK